PNDIVQNSEIVTGSQVIQTSTPVISNESQRPRQLPGRYVLKDLINNNQNLKQINSPIVFSADLRSFSNMLNKTLKNYNQSNDFTPRNISMNESKNDLSDFTLRDNSLNNSRYSNKMPSDFSLRNISLNYSNNSMNETSFDNSILYQSIFQKPPAETTRSKRPISDQTYREITEVAKKKKKVNEIRELNSRPKKRKPVNISKYWKSFK
ncbi:unnamed protein product, partial [Brachionus calyciflorus]